MYKDLARQQGPCALRWQVTEFNITYQRRVFPANDDCTDTDNHTYNYQEKMHKKRPSAN